MGPERQPEQAEAPVELPVAAEAAPEGFASLLRGGSNLRPAQIAMLQRSAGNAAVARLLREVAPPAADRPGGAALLVADDAEPGPGRMRLGAFLDQVEREVTAVAERQLADSIFRAAGCPWIAHWIGYYRGRSPEQVEAAIRRYSPAVAEARTIEATVAAICARVEDGIRVWADTGEVPQPPEDGPGAPPGVAAGASPPDAAAAGRSVAREAVAERGRLGPGRPLDSGVASRLGGALGEDVSGVRIHTDAPGAALAARHGAAATAVGRHIAFAPGAYEPGTPVGDALLAHELAHTVQQAEPGQAVAPEGAAEADADRATVGAVAALWAGSSELARRLARNARPTLRSGLALRSCPMPTASYQPPAPTDLWVRASGVGMYLPGDMPKPEDQSAQVTSQGARFTFDIDGDQKKDTEALVRVNRPPRGKTMAHVELTQISSKRTGKADLEVPQMGAPFDPPMLTLVSDGRRPTEFSVTNALAVRVHPGTPVPNGFMTHEVDVSDRETESAALVTPQRVFFPVDTADNGGPVFSTAPSGIDPNEKESKPQAAGDAWSLDVAVGRFADKFRVTAAGWRANRVTFGLGVVSNDGPAGGFGAELAMPTNNLKLAILSNAGAALELDLNDDGVADLTLYDRLSVPTKDQLASEGVVDEDMLELRSPALHRDHHITVTGRALAAPVTFHFPVRGGMIRAGLGRGTDQNREAASDLRAATGLAEQRALGTADKQEGKLAGELAYIDRTLIGLRQKAFEDKLISKALFDAWQALAVDFIVLAAQQSKDAKPTPDAAAALKERIAVNGKAFYDRLHAETPTTTTVHSKFKNRTENVYTGDLSIWGEAGPQPGSKSPGSDFAVAIKLGLWPQAIKSYRALESGFDRWIAHQNRERYGDPDLTKPESMRGVTGEQLTKQRGALEAISGRTPTRVAAVLHPSEQWEGTGRVVELPLSLYFWKDSGYWRIKDLSKADDMPTWSLPIQAGHEHLTEPPDALLAKLDEGPHFPRGVIHWHLPSGRGGRVETSGPSPLRAWITVAAATAAAIGLGLVTLGAGTVAVIGGYILAGGALLGAGMAAHDLLERAQHDRLTTNSVLLNVAQIVSALAGVGVMAAGRILVSARAAAAAGDLAEASAAIQWANRAIIPLRGVNLGSDLVTFAVMTDELQKQVKAIQDSGAPPDEQSRSLTMLFTQYALTAGLTSLSVKGAIADLKVGRSMSIEVVNGVEYAVPLGTSVEGAAINSARQNLRPAGPGSGIEAHLTQIRTKIPGPGGEALARVENMALKPATDGNILIGPDGVLVRNGVAAGRLDQILDEVARANNAAAAHGLDNHYSVVFDPATPAGTPVRVQAVARGGAPDPAANARMLVASSQGRIAGAGRLAQQLKSVAGDLSVEVLPSGRLRVPGHPDLDAVKLLDDFQGNVALAAELVHRLGSSTARLASDLTGPELNALIAQHGVPNVRWAGTELSGTQTRELLNALGPGARAWLALPRPSRPTPTTVRSILGAIEANRLDAALANQIPPAGLAQAVETQNHAVVRRIIDDAIATPRLWAVVRRNLQNLEVALAPGGELATAGSLAPDAIVADSNVVIVLQRLISGQGRWAGPPTDTRVVQENQRRYITKLRMLAGQLPMPAEFTGTPQPQPAAAMPAPPATPEPTRAELQALMDRIASTGVGMMETARGAAGRGRGFTLDTGRNSDDYNRVMETLRRPPATPWGAAGAPVGTEQGFKDRSVIADALFATRGDPTRVPVFLSDDHATFVRLSGFAERDAGGNFVDFRMPARTQGGNVPERLSLANPNGFVILIEGRRLRVVHTVR